MCAAQLWAPACVLCMASLLVPAALHVHVRVALQVKLFCLQHVCTGRRVQTPQVAYARVHACIVLAGACIHRACVPTRAFTFLHCCGAFLQCLFPPVPTRSHTSRKLVPTRSYINVGTQCRNVLSQIPTLVPTLSFLHVPTLCSYPFLL